MAMAAVCVAGYVAVGVGCEVREERPRRHREVYVEPAPPPPPPPVVYQPAPPPPPVVVYDDGPPPPPPVEVIPVAPGPGFFWIRGGYYHDHGRWAYRRGYYDRRH